MKEYHPTASTSMLEMNEIKITSCFVNRTINKLPMSHWCDLGNFKFSRKDFYFSCSYPLIIQELQNECTENGNPNICTTTTGTSYILMLTNKVYYQNSENSKYLQLAVIQ
jgi:hypothetical protein